MISMTYKEIFTVLPNLLILLSFYFLEGLSKTSMFSMTYVIFLKGSQINAEWAINIPR